MFSRMAWAWKSGPVSTRTMCWLYASRSEGRVRRLRGSPPGETAERHTSHSQPSVGTPMDVPVPRKVRVAFIGLADDARFSGGWIRTLGCGGAGQGLRDLEEGHAELKQRAIEQALLGVVQVALGLF